jgi:uncharacterized delta-60 repeat protein
VTWVTTLVRFLPDGSVDLSFGTNGYATSPPGQFRNVTLDHQQRILVCGWEPNTEMPMVARYESDGTLDSSFGNGGAVLDIDGTSGVASVVHVDPDGKIVVAGERFPPMIFPELCLARLNDDGTVDTTFGQGGVTALEGSSSGANRLLSRSGGGYLLANHSPYNEPLQIIATDASGQLDAGFGEGGIVTLEEPMEFPVLGLLELPDGRILVGGGVVNGLTEQLAVWCLQPNGQLDPDFAEDGVFLLPGMGRATALVADGDGVLVGGFLFHPDSGTDVAILRLLP